MVIEFLVVLMVLLLLSFVGHLFWLFLIWMIRTLSGGSLCKDCQRPMQRTLLCPHCHAISHSGDKPSLAQDLAAAERLVQFGKARCALDAAQSRQLADIILALRRADQPAMRPAAPAQNAPAQSAPAIVPPIVSPAIATLPSAPATSASVPTTPAPVEVHPLDMDDEERDAVRGNTDGRASNEPVVPPSQRAKQWTADMILAFMERSNIRWMELTAATLIVVCSVGLVISLWKTLAGTSRFFPSVVFMLATVAVHGAGQYTLKRWKLQNTSRGILHIALMLIPLSVMIGILLSRREGEAVMDLQFWSVLGVGVLVYGGLAITAAQSLFPKAWLPLAMSVILSSVSLVPIASLAKQSSIPAWAAALLLPAALVSGFAAWELALSAALRQRPTFVFYRRQLGNAVQMLFAMLTVLIFAWMQWQLDFRANEWNWLIVGCLACVWGAWGIVVSNTPARWPDWLSRFLPRTPVQPAVMRVAGEASGMVIFGWLIGIVASVIAAGALWRLTEDRTPLVLMLAIVGVWIWSLGVISRSRFAMTVGSIVSLVCGTLWLEQFFKPSPALVWSDWVGWQRVMVLGGLSGLAASIGWVLARRGDAGVSDPNAKPSNLDWLQRLPSWKARWRARAGAAEFGESLLVGGGGAFAGTMLLSVVASVVPWGSTPYGGDWAPPLLCLYGAMAMMVGMLLQPDRRWVAAIGMGLCMLGTTRVCENATWIPEAISRWRIGTSTCIGYALLALGWLGLAAIAWSKRSASRSAIGHPSNRAIEWVVVASVVLSLAANAGLWMSHASFDLVRPWGWTLPIALIAASWLRSDTTLLESGWIAGGLWMLAWMLFAGQHWELWSQLTPLANVCICFACMMAWVAAGLKSEGRLRSALHAMRNDSPARGSMLVDPSAFAVMAAGCGIAIAGVVLLASSLELANGMGWLSGRLLEADWIASTDAHRRALLVTGGLAIASWSVLARMLSTRRMESTWFGLLGVAGWLAVLWIGCFAWPWGAWMGAMWGQGLVCVLCSRWSLARSKPTEMATSLIGFSAEDGWKWGAPPSPMATLYELSRVGVWGLSLLACIGFGMRWTPGIDIAPWSEAWTAANDIHRWGMTLSWLGPIMLVTLAGWLRSVLDNALAKAIATHAASAAGWMTIAGMMIPATLGNWPLPASVWLLGMTTLSIASMSWMTHAAVWLRNVSELASRRSNPGIPQNAMGRHTDSAIVAAWWLACLSIVPVLALSAVSAVHQILQASGAVTGGLPIDRILTLGMLLAFGALIFSGVRGWIRPSVLAMGVIGILAPIVPNYLHDFLLRGWGFVSAVTAAFQAEPMHAMVIGWLIAMVFGLRLRVPKSLQLEGNSAALGWWGIASASAILALWSPAGVDPRWVMGLGGAVALLLLLRGLLCEHPGPGHMAAAYGAAVLSIAHWLNSGFVAMRWQIDMLWGPVACAAIGLVWMLVSQRMRTATNEALQDAKQPSAPNLLASFATVDQSASLHVPIALCIWSAVMVIASFSPFGMPVATIRWSVVAMSVASVALAIARAWDARSGSRGWAIYVSILSLALVGAIELGHAMGATPDDRFLMWAFGGLAAMCVLAATLREWLKESTHLIPTLRLGSLSPRSDDFQRAGHWICGLHTLIGIGLLPAAVWMVLGNHEPFAQRLSALLPWMSALGILPLATSLRHRMPRIVVLGLATTGALLVAWSDVARRAAMGGDSSANWLQAHYAFAIVQQSFCVLVGLSWIARGLVRPLRQQLDWGALMGMASRLLAAAAFALGLLSLCMTWQLLRGMDAATLPQSIGITSMLAWIGLSGFFLRSAVRKVAGDASLSDRTRQAGLILAEVALLMAAVTMRLHFPWLFAGWVADWWPLIVYALVFASVMLGRWISDRGDDALADPIHGQSLLLPLIPLIGAWVPSSIAPSASWSEPLTFSMLLFGSAVAYAALGAYRQMTLLKVLSITLLLGSFWMALHSQERLRFSEHPQLWIIPPALATLVFLERNRSRFSPSVVTGARYLAVLLIYCSSTMEMMLRAFETQFWSPILLLGLSVLGIMVGIAMRVRAFLFCGSAFVVIALVGMVWHAQRAIQQVWPWWAFGIAMGVAIIVLIGTIEKNRDSWMKTLETLRKWQP
ncbi:MAG: hypothetical protein ACK5OB_16510 [Pirellula sp.]